MTTARVFLWGTEIGVVNYDSENELGAFEYNPDFISSGIEVAPIVMPLSRQVYSFPDLDRRSFNGLPGMLADSLPDKFGNAVIDAWLQSQGRTPESFDPVERLCYTGSRGMGALEYVPAIGPKGSKSSSVEIDRLVKLASDVLRSRKGMHVSFGKDAMRQIIRVGTSAGGARAKAIIAWNEKTGDIRSGQIDAGSGYGYWIIKFDGVENNGDKENDDVPQYTRIEYAYYLMACDAGIEMSECRLLKENDRYHFLTRRFDRNITNGDKLHMQSLGAIAHFDFNLPGAYSYEQAVQVMRRIRLTNNEIKQFYARMVFNVLARNQDDHVKNISFLMNRKGLWSLAPAYDMTYAYNPNGIWTGRHQMTVNGKREDISLNDLLAAANNMGIKKAEAERIIRQINESLIKWPEFAETAELNKKDADLIGNQFLRF